MLVWTFALAATLASTKTIAAPAPAADGNELRPAPGDVINGPIVLPDDGPFATFSQSDSHYFRQHCEQSSSNQLLPMTNEDKYQAVYLACSGKKAHPNITWGRSWFSSTPGNQFAVGKYRPGYDMTYTNPGNASQRWRFSMYTNDDIDPRTTSWTPELQRHCYDSFFWGLYNCMDNGSKYAYQAYETHSFLLWNPQV
jgi:hypothetical protein